MIAALALALTLPGLFAPQSSAQTIGLEATDERAGFAATEIARQLAASGIRVVAIDAEPSASDCSAKPYAAAARVETTLIRGEAGWTLDEGLWLNDCAGWNVDEWHCFVTLAHEPNDADAEKLGMALSLRLRTWLYSNPVIANALLQTGLAYDVNTEGATYFYRLFKTNDGNMRAYVRPGGPAFIAGLRTNDILSKVDGKLWWEYGTYQTEQRAYDGKPHTFEIQRGKKFLTIPLGTPYEASGG